MSKPFSLRTLLTRSRALGWAGKKTPILATVRPVPLIACCLCAAACARHSGLPQPGSEQYVALVSAFYVGLAGLQTGEDVRAREKLTLATEIAPGEPAGWANLGLLELRQQDLDAAYQDIKKAHDLAPDNSRIEAMLGQIESKRGKIPEAIGHLKAAVKLDPTNVRAVYALAEETERQGNAASDAEAVKLFGKILEQQPANLVALLDVARLSAKGGDDAALRNASARLAQESTSWPEEARQRLMTLVQSVNSGEMRGAAVQIAFLKNVLARVPAYRQSMDAVKTPIALVAEPFVRFLRLVSPSSEPAPPDLTSAFGVQPMPGGPERDTYWIGEISLDGEKPTIVWADQDGVQIAGGARLPFPGDKSSATPNAPMSRNGVVGADLNYDFKMDIVLAGASGVRIYQQQDPAHFTDITRKSKLSPSVVDGSYFGAWAFDFDLDGDLDIVLGPSGAEPILLRNNGDSTFAIATPFKGVTGLAAFASADIDGDGDPDVALIDREGRLHIFTNERLGEYRPRALPQEADGRFLAVVPADINGDGYVDFVLLRDDGTVIRLSDKNAGSDWDVAELMKAEVAGQTIATATLQVADFDNNGSLDLLVGDNQIFLRGPGGYTRLAVAPEVAAPSVIDLNGDGRLDLIGISRGSGNPRAVECINHGDKGYRWQTIRTRAAKATGDQRINSFGIGGEIEIRAGLLAEKQSITSPQLHFGLGEHDQADVARIIWPNGFVQGEFELGTDQVILAEQRLKGSCPWLFAWDGKQVAFVKDAPPWSPALGLHINAQVVAGIYRTEEWFKVPGEQLAPRDGLYDLRITAELWETYYIDHYSLLVVDHPADTEIFADERFSNPPPELKIYSTTRPRPFARATDDGGRDVSEIVSKLDERYLDTFGRGQYQGVTRDHWVELALPEEAPPSGRLFFVGHGWMHPTDGTVNIALGQNSAPPPQGLSIEVPDSTGKWVVARSSLGFPAGKMKTVVMDLSGILGTGAPRKLRLRTNLEIYWDKLEWAAEAPVETKTERLQLAQAELRYRGYSVVRPHDDSSPEVPDYNQLGGTGQKWRDLEGYCTRYGDVRELLENIDDRIVITASGDELLLKFKEQPPPPPGWKRDFVLIGDGWIKDGDYNSVFSKTVLPLPFHGLSEYTTPPGRLEDDPAYRRHPDDWQKFHTRYVTPEVFNRALRN